jgi:hypothetical protein
MTGVRQIPVDTGERITLLPTVDAWQTDTGYLIAPRGATPFLVAADECGVIGENAREQLSLRGAIAANVPISDSPEIYSMLFPCSDARERRGIVDLLGAAVHQGPGLEIACGNGRLLLPLHEEGLEFDGLDGSAALVSDLRRRLPVGALIRLFCAPLQMFSAPGMYAYAFCALDAIRGLETAGAIRSHLRHIALSLRPGAPYLLNVTLSPWPPKAYEISKEVVLQDGNKGHACWRMERYLHLRRQIFERISVVNANGNILHEETRLMASLAAPTMLEMVADTPGLDLEGQYDTGFMVTRIPDEFAGNCWLLMRRSHA